MTLNKTYYHETLGAVVAFKYEPLTKKSIWVRTAGGRELLVSRKSLNA